MTDKKLLIILGFVIAALVFVWFAFINSAGATYQHQPEWGACEQLVCGDSAGTQSREVTRYECPQGYSENAFHFTPKDCHKGPIWNLSYAYKIEVSETEVQACTVEEVVACEEPEVPVEEPKGEHHAPTFQGSTTNAPQNICSGIYTSKPIIGKVERLSPTSVWVSWFPVDGADKYSLVYGYVNEDMVHGVAEISKDATSITLNDLRPSTYINVQVWAWKGNCENRSEVIDP